ncbi:MAG: hypothetical protein HQ581_01985 [Planctomycetes bacterium]|nr:hypothetical protein [Planctomycetota bacterium]
MIEDLDRFWEDLVPRTFPYKGDLLGRVPVPTFLKNATGSIAIHSARGDTRLAETVEEDLALLDVSALTGVGVILDADSGASATQRFTAVKEALGSAPLSLPDTVGQVATGSPRCGIYVMPDNVSNGTLEDILLECAAVSYPSLKSAAEKYVGGVNRDDPILANDRKVEFFKPAGEKKAVAGCISSVLKPGKAIQVSIQDNQWIDENTLKLPIVNAVQKFLCELLELS